LTEYVPGASGPRSAGPIGVLAETSKGTSVEIFPPGFWTGDSGGGGAEPGAGFALAAQPLAKTSNSEGNKRRFIEARRPITAS
jgi:hypothetical protein